MTTEKMPDVINISVSKNALGVKNYQVSKLKPNTKYLRAKPVEELLKEAKHLLDGMVNHQIYNSMICGQSNKLIAEINKFLGDK